MNPLEQMPIPLLEWYEQNRRTLPWRESTDPYRIWVSEIMLQQTRVTAVLAYYARFMQELPTVRDLAAVPEERLLKLWEGLGYYSRARNLQKAARQMVDEWGGQFPTDYAGLRQLAGVGEYTAAAIASIAYGAPYPAVDGNLLRVVARVTADFDDITTPAMKRKVNAALTEVIPLHAPGAFNQAMMDLGAMICLPNGAPLCDRCPLAELCRARQEELSDQLPVRKAKKARRIEEREVWLLLSEGRVALHKRPAHGLLASLWEFPNTLVTGEEAFSLPEGLCATEPRFAAEGKHIFSHVEWRMRAYTATAQEDDLPEGWVWVSFQDLCEQYALPTAFSLFLPTLQDLLQAEGEAD